MSKIQENSDFLDSIKKFIKGTEEKAIKAAVYAHTNQASLAVQKLKTDMSVRGPHIKGTGSKGGPKVYEHSVPGDLPHMQSGLLRNSLGFKVFTKGNIIESEVGSGAMGMTPVEYAEHIAKLRPFAPAIQEDYNIEKISEAWKEGMENIK